MGAPVANRPLFGPFKRTPDEFAEQWTFYKGRPQSPYELKMAFGHSGDVEIELVQWVSVPRPSSSVVCANCVAPNFGPSIIAS